MKRARGAAFAVLVLTGVLGLTACDGEEVLDFLSVDLTPRLDLVPPAVSMRVGLSAPLTPRLEGTALSGEIPSWSTSDPQVATVDAAGNVTCVGPGTATITALIDQSGPDDSVGRATVTCLAPPLLELDVARLELEHVVGQSGCPDSLEPFSVTNPGTVPVVVEVASGNPALRASTGSVRLEPGQTALVELLFDCSTRTSFSTTVDVTATADDGSSEVASVDVTVTIRD